MTPDQPANNNKGTGDKLPLSSVAGEGLCELAFVEASMTLKKTQRDGGAELNPDLSHGNKTAAATNS